MALPGRFRPGKPPSLIRHIGGTKHPEIGGCFVREKFSAPAVSESLRGASRAATSCFGLGSLREGRIELQEAIQAVLADESDEGLVVERRGRVESVAPPSPGR